MPDTTITKGTIIKWNALVIGEASKASGLSSPSSKINIGSFADTVMKTRPGRRNAGEFTVEFNYNPDNATQIAMNADAITGIERQMIIKLPEGTLNTIIFQAQILNITWGADDNNIYKGVLTFNVSSIPTRTTT